MDNLFSDIKNFGIESVPNMYFTSTAEANDKLTVWCEGDPEEYIFEKTFTCPVCEKDFKSSKLKSKKAKLEKIDRDLRPIYNVLDSVAYDTISCTNCRYTGSNTNFNNVMESQVELLINGITNKVSKNKHMMVYTYDYAIDRYKLAILSSYIKKGPASERAFYYMKLAWLYRSINDKVREYYFLEQSYEGYSKAFIEEKFPMMGNDEHTFKLIISEIARIIGRYNEAKRWIGSLLVDRNVNEKIRKRGEDIKELITKDLKK